MAENETGDGVNRKHSPNKENHGKDTQQKAKNNDEITINIADEHPQFLYKLKTILKIIMGYNSEKEKTDIYTTFSENSNKNRSFLHTKKLIQVLRSCLISQRYRKAVPILDIITNKTYALSGTDLVIYKASFQILENLIDEEGGDKVEYFIRQSAVLKEVNKRELVLEYLIYRIRRGQFDIPRDVIQAKLFRGSKLRSHYLIDPLLKAYISMLDFVIWANEVQSTTEDEEENENCQGLGDKIVSTICDVLSNPGPWDIFIEKVLQVLQHQKKLEDCTKVLTNYVEINPDHLHAHVYLEQHLRSEEDTSKREKSLINIAKISPSDPLVLDYVDILFEGNNIKAVLNYLFIFMDYAINKQNTFGWSRLFKVSWKIYQENKKQDVTELETLWTERESYWPQYHYDNEFITIDSMQDAELHQHKCAFLCIVLKNHNHEYVQIVLQLLKEKFPKKFQRLMKVIKKINPSL